MKKKRLTRKGGHEGPLRTVVDVAGVELPK